MYVQIHLKENTNSRELVSRNAGIRSAPTAPHSPHLPFTAPKTLNCTFCIICMSCAQYCEIHVLKHCLCIAQLNLYSTCAALHITF